MLARRLRFLVLREGLPHDPLRLNYFYLMNSALKGLIPVVVVVILIGVLLSGMGVVVEAGHVGVRRTLELFNQRHSRKVFT